MAIKSKFQFFVDTAVEWARVKAGEPPSAVKVGMSGFNHEWANLIGNAAGFHMPEIVGDAAWCGALCLHAAQRGLRIGFTSDGVEFHDITPAIDTPSPELSKELITARVSQGVSDLIEMGGRPEGRVVSDGLHLMQLLARNTRQELVIADPCGGPGKPILIPDGELYPIVFEQRDYRYAARLAFQTA